MNAAEKLRRSLQALAQPAAFQVLLFPDFAVVGDELALTFEDALTDFRASGQLVSETQAAGLAELDQYMTALAGQQNAEFWTDPAFLETDSRWERIRELATATLDAFSWPADVPPYDGAIYVTDAKVVRNI